jgi:maleylacetoacetate isomerase
MFARARVRALVEAVNADTQPLQNRHVLLHVSKDAEAQKTWGKHFVARGLEALEGLMAMNAKDGVTGRFAFGDTLTAADLFLVPQLYNARRFGVDLAPYPRVVAAEQAALETEAAQAASPEQQKDAPADAKK